MRHDAMDTLSGHNQSQHKEEEDRLSALPDDILLNILERLVLRNAVQTTTLSRRWMHLSLMLSRLVFDANDFLEFSDRRTLNRVMTSYCKATRKLLGSTRVFPVKDLHLIFYLADLCYLFSIGLAVGNAVESGSIECLEFNIWPEIRPKRCTEEHLKLFGQRFMSFLDACPKAFGCLTSLTLRRLQFGEADVQNILDTCEKLQALSLDSCEMNQFDTVLKIEAPNSKLVVLKFVRCYFRQIELICVPQLDQLVYDTWVVIKPPLRFGYLPLLHNLRLGSTLMFWQVQFALSGYLSNARNLSTLYLDFHDEMIWFKPENPKKLATIFKNLKTVHLYDIFPECDLQWTLLFLQASPSLDSLYLKISRHVCGRNKHTDNADKTNVLCESSGFKHYNLNLLGITGFAMEEKLINYVKLVMERAVALKKIYLYDKEQCESCNRAKQSPLLHLRSSFPINDEEKNLVRRQLTNGLLSSSIDINIE